MLHLLAFAPSFAPKLCHDLQADAFSAAISGLSVDGVPITDYLKSCADVQANGGCVGPSGFEGVSAADICPVTCGLCPGAEVAERRSMQCTLEPWNGDDICVTPWGPCFDPVGDVCPWCVDNTLTQIQFCRRSCYVGDSGCAQCHPAAATLELEGGRTVRIDEARVGDKVRAPSGFEPITGFLHAEGRHADYLRFTTAGGASVDISVLHYLVANGKETDPADVVVGDVLETAGGPEAVVRVEQVQAFGMYHIFVKGGAYFVDGVLASDYVGLVPPSVWPLVRAYVEARAALGVPIVPAGRGLIPNHAWATDLLQRLGAPPAVQRAFLFPLTIASGVGTELINAVAEKLSENVLAAAGTVAAAAVAARAWRSGLRRSK